MLCLEDKHIVESTADAQWHCVWEGSLSKGYTRKTALAAATGASKQRDPGTYLVDS